MLKNVCRRLSVVVDLLHEHDGSVIPGEAKRIIPWEEQFKELLKHIATPNTAFKPTRTPSAERYSCEVNPPSLEEVRTAVRQLSNNRAPGEDGITAEIYKTWARDSTSL